MNKVRLNQMLDLLLLPFCNSRFLRIDEDVIIRQRYAWQLFRESVGTKKRHADLTMKYREENDRLIRFLNDAMRSSYNSLPVDDYLMMLAYFYPEDLDSFRFEGSSEKEMLISGADRAYFQMIRKLSRSLLTFRDGRVAIKNWYDKDPDKELFYDGVVFDKVELWNGISRRFSADTLVASFLVDSGREEPHYAVSQNGYIQLSDKMLEAVIRRGIAETHLHFNAGINEQFMWVNWMHPARWQGCLGSRDAYDASVNGHCVSFPVMIYRLLWADYLESVFAKKDRHAFPEEGFFAFCEAKYSRKIETIRKILCMFCDGELTDWSRSWAGVLDDLMLVLQKDAGAIKEADVPVGIDYLLSTVYAGYSTQRLFSEMLLMIRSFAWLKQRKKADVESHMFLQYLRCKNLFIKEFLQNSSTEGLLHFQQNYLQAVDDHWEKHLEPGGAKLLYTFQSLGMQGHLRKLEIRITPPEPSEFVDELSSSCIAIEGLKKDYLRKIKLYLSSYADYLLLGWGTSYGQIWNWDYDERRRILKSAGERLDCACEEYDQSYPTLGILFHFVKKDFPEDLQGDVCWRPESRRLVQNLNNLITWRKRMMASAAALEELRSSIPLLGEYVVGLDAASIENDAEPWVFAPVFSNARNHFLTNPMVLHKGKPEYVRNMGFTYHVGEEFRHLFTGLRHIDEVVTHFSYKSGDRLGHAIALGTDAVYWAESKGFVTMLLRERLEDLLWLWGKVIYDRWNLSVSIPVIEAEIHEIAMKIFEGFSPEIKEAEALYRAYQLRFSGDFEKIFRSQAQQEGNGVYCPFSFCGCDNNSAHFAAWNQEKIFCAWFCPLFMSRMKKPVIVQVDTSDLAVIREIQELLIEKLSKNGIYVEVNPTSNMLIGSVDEMEHHPVFKLYERGLVAEKEHLHEVMVTINSDDPVVFHTNTENEYAYIYHALIRQGYHKGQILSWIENVRAFGVNSSFIGREKKPSKMLLEIDELIHLIDGHLRGMPDG